MTIIRSVLAIVAIYLELALPVSATIRVPHIAAFMLAVTLLPRFRYRRWVLVATVTAVGFCAFNVMSTSFGSVPLMERAKSTVFLLWLFSISVVLMASSFPEGTDRRRVCQMFLAAGFSLLAFAFLEQRTPLAQVSDTFRLNAYGRIAYENDQRDEVLLGGTRPKAFTEEPSFAGRGISLLLLFGAMLARRTATRLAALAGIGAAVLVTGSPKPVVFALCLLCGLPVPQWCVRRKLVLPFQVFMGILAVAVIFVAVQTVPVLRQRFETIESGTDRSLWRRTGFMREMAGQALRHNPVSGVGFGGEDELSSDFTLPGLENDPTTSLINNAMWSIPFFTGITGSLLVAALLFALTRRLPAEHRLVFLLTIFATLNTTGSISSTSAWFIGAMLHCILAHPSGTGTGSQSLNLH